LTEIIRQGKLRPLQMHGESGVSHVGIDLSGIDLSGALHHPIRQEDADSILSTGHAGARCATPCSRGLLTDMDVQQFYEDDTRVAGHWPVRRIPGIAFATGSRGPLFVVAKAALEDVG
jgi:transketolase N-terminal domain/subunit